VARAASAPHAGEEGPRYPGSCRGRTVDPPADGRRGAASGAFLAPPEGPWKRPPAIRLRVPDRVIAVADAFQGAVTENVAEVAGDFVLRRGDGVYAYQLAVAADDLAMGITEVVRGADLLSSAPRQKLLAELLGGTAPEFAHLPLVVGPDGERLAKRKRGVSLGDQRAGGRRPEELVGELAALLGLVDAAASGRTPAAAARELVACFDPARLAGKRVVRSGP
jgi:glutamyl-tRNA synthetase